MFYLGPPLWLGIPAQWVELIFDSKLLSEGTKQNHSVIYPP